MTKFSGTRLERGVRATEDYAHWKSTCEGRPCAYEEYLRVKSITGGEWSLRDFARRPETNVFLCEPETFIYFRCDSENFGVISEMRVRDLCS